MCCSIRCLICLASTMILSLIFGFCLAEGAWEFERGDLQYYESYSKQIYDANETDYKHEIVWTIMHDEKDQQELHLLKCMSLESGQVMEWTIENEYIIQKDPDEYDGVLYAVEDDEQVQIWLMQPDGRREQLASYTITYPYWCHGPQTVRAYMHGTLYYIKSLEKVSPKEADVSWHAAVLCSIDAKGNEYIYHLNNNADPVDAVFHYFAISPHGKVAWVTASEANRYRYFARSIMLEIPGQDVKSVLPEGIEGQMGWDTDTSYQSGGIYGQSLCWIDDDHLMFGSFGITDGYRLPHLYILQPDCEEVRPLSSVDNEPIKMYHSIQGASCVYYNREENLIAYLGSPNAQIEWDLRNDEAAVPHIIDLNTGKNYVLYQIKATSIDEGEFRNQTGQLSWMKTGT